MELCVAGEGPLFADTVDRDSDGSVLIEYLEKELPDAVLRLNAETAIEDVGDREEPLQPEVLDAL